MIKRKRFRGPQKSLPIDIIQNEILVKLPARSLLRCRCVSKLWCSIIDDPSFASSHFKKCQSNQEKNRLLVLEPPDIIESKQFCAIRNGEKFRKMSKIGLDVTWFEQYQAVSYVNGLICMKRYIKETQISNILLWNPSIRKALELPFSQFSNDAKIRHDIDCALGYDHINNDYKVVASVYIGDDPLHPLHIPRHVYIFTLSTFSWKSANTDRGPCLWIKGGPKVFVKGVIYWGGIYVLTKPSPKGRFSHFVSFDVINDVFKYIDLPDSEHVNIWEYERFPILLDQSIALLEIFESYSQIWVMEDSKGMEQSWTKRFNINLQLLERCIYFKMDGELLFTGEKGGVNSYNIRSHETKVLAKSYKLSPIFVSVYRESLTLLKGIPERASFTFPSHGTSQIE
ncbi:F-box protein CPR1 [Bienertia sinuspersici]